VKKTIKTNLLFLILAVLTTAILYGCKEDSVTNQTGGPEANSVNGRITFADTNFLFTGGYYDVAAFTSTPWPPQGPPSGNDSLVITKVGNIYQADYSIKGLSNGDYIVAVGWRPDIGGQSPVMGIYGCDTSHASNNPGCVFNPTKVTITNNAGVANINILSWADTTKQIFYH
jgi:hypothetical protein